MSERDDRKIKGGCIPVRRKIASGGKEGSYADPRTGGKQAYLALKEAKPPGSAGGWTKKNCICCHKCKNDRSAPNGFVCMNPAHLYWGSKADNTYDQNRGNGWAAENKKSLEENTYLKGDRVMKLSRTYIRNLLENIILEQEDDEGVESMRDALSDLSDESSDSDAKKIYDALSGIGTDEETILDILKRRKSIDIQKEYAEFLVDIKETSDGGLIELLRADGMNEEAEDLLKRMAKES